MVDVALGTKVFTRTEKLRSLLQTVEQTDIGRVYVADDGEQTPEKTALYECDYDFELRIIDLEYDAGLGKGRKEIVDHLEDETYLLIVDTDHEIPPNVSVLVDQLEAQPSVGGIAGNIVEPERGRMFQSAKDLAEEGNVLVRSADLEPKAIEDVAGYPFVPFQFIPNAAMFRTACLEDYCWDPNYVIGKEHIDFYVGHWKQTDWQFGVSPAVTFNHYPGGEVSYEQNRYSSEKNDRSDQYFLEKWGYEAVRTDRSYWFDTESVQRTTLFTRVREIYNERGVTGVIKKSIKSGPRVIQHRFR